MRWLRLLGVPVFLASSCMPAVRGSSDSPEPFRHSRHRDVTADCGECHTLAAAGVSVPGQDSCDRCHDGESAFRVIWSGREPRRSNFDFSHTAVLEAKRENLGYDFTCGECHQRGDSPMSVGRPRARTCMSCHAPDEEHLVGASCRDCHTSLANARGFGPEDVEALPKPSDHTEEFEPDHSDTAQGNRARCLTCHERQWCSSCHSRTR